MSYYLEVWTELLERPELIKLLLKTGIYYEYNEAIAILSQYYHEYMRDNYDFLLKNLNELNYVRIVALKFLAAYLAYKGKSNDEIEKICRMVNDYIVLIITQIQRYIEELMAHSRGTRAQHTIMLAIEERIGDLIMTLRNIFKNPENATFVVASQYVFTKELVKKYATASRKLKEAEKILEETVEEVSVPISVAEEVTKSIDKELYEVRAKLEQERGSKFTEKEIKLLEFLVNNNLIGDYQGEDLPILKLKLQGALGESSWKKVINIAKSINAKAMELCGTPILYIDKDKITIQPQLFEQAESCLRKYIPHIVAAYEERKMTVPSKEGEKEK